VLRLTNPRAALAAGLGNEPNATDLDTALDTLASRRSSGRDRGGGHRLHLDAGLAFVGRLRPDAQDTRRAVG